MAFWDWLGRPSKVVVGLEFAAKLDHRDECREETETEETIETEGIAEARTCSIWVCGGGVDIIFVVHARYIARSVPILGKLL